MQTTTLTQQGNSNSVILPAALLKEANWKRGQKLTIDYVAETDGFIIRRVKKSQPAKQSEKEFQKWLKTFLEEDAELLDKLA
jgi:antitoxin component of MazEF toxin-antitoxin module